MRNSQRYKRAFHTSEARLEVEHETNERELTLRSEHLQRDSSRTTFSGKKGELQKAGTLTGVELNKNYSRMKSRSRLWRAAATLATNRQTKTLSSHRTCPIMEVVVWEKIQIQPPNLEPGDTRSLPMYFHPGHSSLSDALATIKAAGEVVSGEAAARHRPVSPYEKAPQHSTTVS